MTAESNAIAARLAVASEVFPLVRQDDWDDWVHVTADGDVINVVVTDRLGRAKREYRAVVQLVAETPTAPADPGASTPGGSRREHPTPSRKDVRP